MPHRSSAFATLIAAAVASVALAVAAAPPAAAQIDIPSPDDLIPEELIPEGVPDSARCALFPIFCDQLRPDPPPGDRPDRDAPPEEAQPDEPPPDDAEPDEPPPDDSEPAEPAPAEEGGSGGPPGGTGPPTGEGGFTRSDGQVCFEQPVPEEPSEGGGPGSPLPFLGVGGILLDRIPDGDDIDRGIDSVIARMFGRENGGCLESSIIRNLVAIPNFAGSELKAVARSTSSAAMGLLAATMTFAMIHFYLSGLTLFGGQALQTGEGIRRAVGAAIFIAIWPWLFENLVALANATSAAVLSPVVQDMAIGVILKVFYVSLAVPALPFILAVLLGLVGMGLVLALFMLKVAMGAVLSVIFVSMPIVAALWVLPSLAWVSRIVSKAFTVVLAVPLIWALCFAAFAAVGTDAFRLSELNSRLSVAGDEDSSLITLLIDPLVGFMLVVLLIAIPKMFMGVMTMGGAMPVPGTGGGSGGGGGIADKATDVGKSGLQMQNQKNFQAGMLQNQQAFDMGRLAQQARFDQGKLALQGEQNESMLGLKKEQGEQARQDQQARNAPAKGPDGIPFSANQKRKDQEFQNLDRAGRPSTEMVENAYAVMDAHGYGDAVRAFDDNNESDWDFGERMASAAAADKQSPELQEAFRVYGGSTWDQREGLYEQIDARRDDAAYHGGSHRAPEDGPDHDSYVPRHQDPVAAAPQDHPYTGQHSR